MGSEQGEDDLHMRQRIQSPGGFADILQNFPALLTQVGNSPMKKTLQTSLSDRELIELLRILIDEDEEAALTFLKKHFQREVKRLLEGG